MSCHVLSCLVWMEVYYIREWTLLKMDVSLDIEVVRLTLTSIPPLRAWWSLFLMLEIIPDLGDIFPLGGDDLKRTKWPKWPKGTDRIQAMMMMMMIRAVFRTKPRQTRRRLGLLYITLAKQSKSKVSTWCWCSLRLVARPEIQFNSQGRGLRSKYTNNQDREFWFSHITHTFFDRFVSKDLDFWGKERNSPLRE